MKAQRSKILEFRDHGLIIADIVELNIHNQTGINNLKKKLYELTITNLKGQSVIHCLKK